VTAHVIGTTTEIFGPRREKITVAHKNCEISTFTICAHYFL